MVKMKKKDEKRRSEELHQQKLNQMIKSAEDSAGLLHNSTRSTAWKGGVSQRKKKRMSDCWTAVK